MASYMAFFIDANTGIKVLEVTLGKDTSDGSDLSGIRIKFALTVGSYGDASADKHQATVAVTEVTEGVGTGIDIVTGTQAFGTTDRWIARLRRIALYGKLVVDLARVIGAAVTLEDDLEENGN